MPTGPQPKEECPDCGLMIASMHMNKHRKAKHALVPEDDMPSEPTVDASPDDGPFAGAVEGPITNGTGEERPKKRRLWDRVKGGNTDAPSGPPPTKERKPKSTRGRKSAATLLGMGMEIGSTFAEATPYQATARMMAVQAPYAGFVLDEALAGSLVDRVALQPIARMEGRAEAVGAILGPTMLTLQIERLLMAQKDGQAYRLIPLLKRSLRMAAPHIVKGMKKRKAQDDALQEAMSELFPTMPPGETPLDAMIQDIFAPVVASRDAAARSAPQPQEEPVP